MGPQDGVENVLHMLDQLVHTMGRRDVHVALLGFGDCLEDLQRLSSELGLDEWVTFTGRVEAPEIARYLSTADVGLSPDPFNPLNDLSTMNKTMEYMAFGLPVVAFGLSETRVSAGDAAVYVEPDDVDGFAVAVAELLDDPDRRALLGKRGRGRAVELLDWKMQAGKYVGVYHQLLRGDRRFVLLPTGERIIDRRAGERRGQPRVPALHAVGSPEPDRRRGNRRAGPSVRPAASVA
jgi:glycosyltransferase involved in cell wall biosynthesis